MRTRIVGTNTLMLMVENLRKSGEISNEQYRKVKERNEKLSKLVKEDVVIDEVIKNGWRNIRLY